MHAHEDGHFGHGSDLRPLDGSEQLVEVHETDEGIGHVDGIAVHGIEVAQVEVTHSVRLAPSHAHEDGHFGHADGS